MHKDKRKIHHHSSVSVSYFHCVSAQEHTCESPSMEAAKCCSYTSTRPHFFKPLLQGFRQGILIPIAFLKYLHVKRVDEFDNEALLKTDFGEWNVKIRGGVLKGQGWVDFVEHHDLEVGDVLVFKHHGDLVFDVTIFDPSACELEYTTTTLPEDHHEGGEEEDSPISDLNELKQHFANSSIARSKAEACSPCFVSSLKRYSCEYSKFLIPHRFAKSHGLCGRHCKVVIIDAENKERTWKVSLRHSSRGEVLLGGGWAEFRVANRLKVGDRLSFELIRKGAKPVMVFHRANGTSRAAVVREKTTKFASQTPQTYTYTCNQTCLAYYELPVPKVLVELTGLSKNCDVTIKDPNERHWPVSLRDHGRLSYRVCQGWKEVALANDLKIGDVIKLELVKRGEETLVMNLSICSRSSGNGGLYNVHRGGIGSVNC